MRQFLKHRMELVLASRQVGRLARDRVRDKTLILAYHGVVPHHARSVGERALFVAQSAFGEQLDALLDVADVAPLAQLDEPGDGRPRVAITFDDAYQGAVTCAVDELAKRRLPATIFVAPGRLNGHAFWWDVLADDSGAMSADVRMHALEALCGDDDRVRHWAAERRMTTNDSLPAFARAATEAELRSALGYERLTLGSHSWSHANLARLEAPALNDELRRPLAWLRGRFAAHRVVPWLAYPYGSESDAVRDAAAASGYVGALRIDGGWHRRAEVSPFGRPRLNVPAGLSVPGLRARLIGSIQR